MNDTPNSTNQQNELPFLASASDNPKYKRVGGWLLLFCLGLTVLSPLIVLASLAVSYDESSKYFSEFPRLWVIFIIDTVLGLGVMAFGVYAGVGLWRIRPGAVRLAKRYLLCSLGYQIVVAILPFMAGLPSVVNEAWIAEAAKATFKSVTRFAIWYPYLNKSKRVRATYGG